MSELKFEPGSVRYFPPGVTLVSGPVSHYVTYEFIAGCFKKYRTTRDHLLDGDTGTITLERGIYTHNDDAGG